LATRQVLLLAIGILSALLVLTACQSTRDFVLVVGTFVVVVTIVAGPSIASGGADFYSIRAGSAVEGRLTGLFENANQFATMCALAAPLASVLIIVSRGPLARLLFLIALGIALTGLSLSLSRGAWIGTGLAFVFLLATLREIRRAAVLLAVPVVLAGVLIFTIAPTQPDLQVIGTRAKDIGTLGRYDQREEIWAEAIREISTRPVAGYGPNSFSIASARASLDSDLIVSASHAHNIFLAWGAEAGLPAIFFLVGLIVSVAIAGRRAARVLKRSNRRLRVLLAGVSAALIALLGQSMFDYTLGNAVVFVSTWLLLGLVLAVARYAGIRPHRR
jgi:O-antigen ligase